MDWRRKWQPIPVFLPGKFHGQRSLVGYSPGGCRVRHNWTPTHTMPPPLSTFLPDQTLGLCRDYFWNLILRFHRSALEVLLVPAWEPGCLCFAALSWQGTGKQQVAMHLVCSWTGYHVITTSSPCHLQCGSLVSPSFKLRFTSLKEELGHCWTMLISAKARCIFSWGLWQSAPKWSLFNKGISSNWKKNHKSTKFLLCRACLPRIKSFFLVLDGYLHFKWQNSLIKQSKILSTYSGLDTVLGTRGLVACKTEIFLTSGEADI